MGFASNGNEGRRGPRRERPVSALFPFRGAPGIAGPVCCHLRIRIVVGQPVEQREVGVVHIQPLLEHGEDSVLLQLAVLPFQHLPLPVRLVVEFRQLRRLGGFEKHQKTSEHRLVDGELGVEVHRPAASMTLETGVPLTPPPRWRSMQASRRASLVFDTLMALSQIKG